MNIGDKVKVYEDPFTREKLEGVAVVRRIASTYKDGDLRITNVVVNFPEDGNEQVVQRTIVEGVVLDIAAAADRKEAAG